MSPVEFVATIKGAFAVVMGALAFVGFAGAVWEWVTGGVDAPPVDLDDYYDSQGGAP